MTGIVFHVGYPAPVANSLRTITVGHPHDKSCKQLQSRELGSLTDAQVKEQAFLGGTSTHSSPDTFQHPPMGKSNRKMRAQRLICLRPVRNPRC